MKPVLRALIPLAIFLVVAGFLFKGLFLNPKEVPSPLIGKPAPHFNLPRLDDPTKTFSPKDMLGKVWLFNAWASWCSTCRTEHAVLMEIVKTPELNLVGLNYKDTDAEAQSVLNTAGNPYQLVVTDSDGKVGIDYGVVATPETYVIDKEGIIRYKKIGAITREDAYAEIIPMIKELQK
ncbi:MAG: DsbE family thiol:disulfide interchange protein [Methylotenera sp.]|nr:DsbE family thiol:disulfide interchange protein [Methylotenera sp.]